MNAVLTLAETKNYAQRMTVDVNDDGLIKNKKVR